MNKIDKKAKPSWSDIKSKLSDFDRVGLLGLVHDLYAASKDNQTFLHARFGLGDDVCNGQLKPDTFLSRFLIEFPLKFQRGLVA